MNKRCSSAIVGRALACINMRETCKKCRSRFGFSGICERFFGLF